MRLGVDARPLMEKKSGIGTYLDAMLSELLELSRELELYLISDGEICFPEHPRVRKIRYKGFRFLPNTLYFEFLLPRFLRREGIVLDAFWGTQQFMPLGLPKGCRRILTVHDLTYRVYPSLMDRKLLFMLRLFGGSSLREADRIVTVSRYTMKTLLSYYKRECSGKEIQVIYPSATTHPLSEEQLPEGLSEKKYILFIGILEPRKNLDVLIDAFQGLKEGGLKLVVCGKCGWNYEETLRRIEADPDILYPGFVSNERKQLLLAKSLCLVMPSLYEGFGTPAVEAMKSGATVVAADNSSLSEVVGIPELLFPTGDAGALREILRRLLGDPSFRREMEEKSRRRGEDFSWKAAAEEFLELIGGKYEEA